MFAMSKGNIVPKLFRSFSESNIQRGNNDRGDTKETSNASTRHRRVMLKCGRARRKWESKQREDSSSSAKTETSSSGDGNATNKKNTNQDIEKADEKEDNANTMIFGIPMGNPIRERYIRSQQKIKYPKTWSGWKAVWKRAWAKYLWTFEGFLLKEKKRDAEGNIIPQDQQENDPNKEEDKSLHDKATETASKIALNVQKNISTLKEETPKLVQMGQQITGVSTKEELREWVGNQLKLGTACLSEFMKGYRKGRDEEVDRMLHEYFKDLDDKKEPDEVGADENLDNDNGTLKVKRVKRTWGRRERRRLKALGDKLETALAESAVST